MAGLRGLLIGATAMMMLVIVASAQKDESTCLQEMEAKVNNLEFSKELSEWLSKLNLSEEDYNTPSSITKERISEFPVPHDDCKQLVVSMNQIGDEVGECIYDIDFDIGQPQAALDNNKKLEIFVNGLIACKVASDHSA